MPEYIILIVLSAGLVLTIYWLAGKLADYFDPYDYED